LTFSNPDDYDRIDQDDILSINGIRDVIRKQNKLSIMNNTKNERYVMEHSMSARQLEMVVGGSLINVVRGKFSDPKV
jgi:aconitate hydratase